MSFLLYLKELIFITDQSGMSIIYMLLTISVIVAIGFFIVFIISVKKGQYDDVYTPSIRMLFEDEVIQKPKDSEQSKITNTKKNK